MNGRELAPSQIVAASALFRQFGEIEALGSNCTENLLEIRVFGVRPRELDEYERTGEEPDPEFYTIRLSREGIVFVR